MQSCSCVGLGALLQRRHAGPSLFGTSKRQRSPFRLSVLEHLEGRSSPYSRCTCVALSKARVCGLSSVRGDVGVGPSCQTNLLLFVPRRGCECAIRCGDQPAQVRSMFRCHSLFLQSSGAWWSGDNGLWMVELGVECHRIGCDSGRRGGCLRELRLSERAGQGKRRRLAWRWKASESARYAASRGSEERGRRYTPWGRGWATPRGAPFFCLSPGVHASRDRKSVV